MMLCNTIQLNVKAIVNRYTSEVKRIVLSSRDSRMHDVIIEIVIKVNFP